VNTTWERRHPACSAPMGYARDQQARMPALPGKWRRRDSFLFFFRQLLIAEIPRHSLPDSGVEEVPPRRGEDCYIVRVRVAKRKDLGRLVRDKIERIKSVSSTRTTLVLKTLKDKKPVANLPSTGAIAPSLTIDRSTN